MPRRAQPSSSSACARQRRGPGPPPPPAGAPPHRAPRRPAARAVEQRLSQGRLQRRDLVRQRGLGKAERGRRGPERPEFGDGQDRLELAQAQPTFDRLYRSQLRHFLILPQVFLTLNWPMSQTDQEDIVLRATRTTAEGRLFRLLIGA